MSVCMLSPIMDSIAAADTIIYGGNISTFFNSGGDVIEINLTTNSSQKVDEYLFDTQAIAQDPTTGFVYYFENTTLFPSRQGNELAYWDPATSTNTHVRTYESPPWDATKRAAFDQNGVLYLMDSGGELFIVDMATGDLESKGQVQGIPTAISSSGDMAFSPDGTLYLVINANLYRIDLDIEPLEAVPLASNMISGNVWSGLAYCNGSLYASDVSFLGGSSAIFHIGLDGDTVTEVTEWISRNTIGYMLNDLTSCPATVGDVNSPPVLELIGDRGVDIGENLQIVVTATDPNPDDMLTYTTSVLPDGASFDLDTHIFDWTPIAGQEGLHEITFTVTDNGNPQKEDSETITIVVGNLAPELNPIGDKNIGIGELLEFTVTATDPNLDDILTYTTSALPAGASLDPDTHIFDWTPIAGQEGLYGIEFTVYDRAASDPEALSDSETIIIVAGNLAPELNPIGDKNIGIGELLEFTVTATDPNLDDILTYTTSALPAGASLDPDTHIFDWTPIAGQEGLYGIEFTVYDRATSDPEALSDSETIIITAGNLAPELNPIGDKNIRIGELLEFTVTATDPNLDDILTYTTSDLPAGAGFNPDTQAFSWTPIAGQVGLHEITFTVIDNGNPQKEDSETIIIAAGNLAPELNPIGDKYIGVGELLEFTVTATDPNLNDILTYSTSVLPTGADFNPVTRGFSWTPGEVGDSPYQVTFTVTDNGDPILDDSETIFITVEEPCVGDYEPQDGDVDGLDLYHLSAGDLIVNIDDFAICFGRSDCPTTTP